MNKEYTSLGLMSGTSGDGVDASIIQSDGNTECSIVLDQYFEYEDKIRQNLINVRSKVFQPNHLKDHFEEIRSLERELTILLAIDVSESGAYGSKELSKRERLAELGALLAFAANRNGDKIGLLLFSDHLSDLPKYV